MIKHVNLYTKFHKFVDYWSPKVIAEMNDYQFKLVKIKGGGGSPVHLMRNLSMQICNNKDFAYQIWVIRHIEKDMITETKLSKF